MSGEFDVDLTEGKNSYKEQKQRELVESIRDTSKIEETQKIISEPAVEVVNEPAIEVINNVEEPTIDYSVNDKLKLHQEFIAFLIINFYEFFLGMVSGFVLNELFFKVIPFKKEGNPVLMFISMTVMVTITISIILILRKSSKFLPYVSGIYSNKDFKHPPPIAITFSLWRTLNQVKHRSKFLQEILFTMISGTKFDPTQKT